jgi:excisionase family DNA binding protein
MITSTEKIAYQIREAVALSGVSRSALYREISAGRLRAIKAGGRRLIRKDDLDAFLQPSRAAA